jgi:cation/acetate symporter
VGILPISAGVFGVPLGFAVIIIVSLLTPAPARKRRNWSSMCATRT